MKTCIYARRSTSKLGQNETINNQIKICQSHADRLGLEIVDIKEDTGSGTDDLNRPEVKELIDDALNGKYECVIMKGISRFYRNVAKGLELVDLLDRNNIRVITIEESYDTEESRYGTGKLDNSKISMFLTFSEMESRKLGDRIKYTQIEKAKAGEWNIAPRPPYGYKYNPDTKKLAVIRSEAEVVEIIYDLYVNEGLGIKKIVDYLSGENPDGIVYPNRNNSNWSYSKVRYILTNETYTGAVVYNKRTKKQVPYKVPERTGRERTDFRLEMVENDREKWIINENAHESIISIELFEKVQGLLKTKARNIGVKRTYSLLAGISKCGKCGSGMYLKKMGMRNGKPRPSSYYCVTYAKRGKKHCTSHHINQHVLEGYVFDHLRELYDDEAKLNRLIDSNRKLITNSDDLTLKIKEYESEINDLNSKTDILLEKNMAGEITDAQFKRMNEKYTQEVEKLNDRLSQLKSQHSESLSDVEKIRKFKRKLKDMSNFEKLTHHQKRTMLLTLVERVTVTPVEDNELDINIKYKFEI